MTINSTHSLGVVGAGNMGRAVAGAVERASDEVTIGGVFDPDPRSIRRARSDWGDAFIQYASLEDLCADPQLDWVMIASWNVHHADQVIAAFEAGKHVFCQKPLATTLEDCLRMRAAWQASGKRFVIGFNLRYSPHYRQIKQIIDAGTIGRLISFEFNETLDFNHGGFIHGDWRRLTRNAGSHLLEKCCHDVDLANWMVGSRARRVASFGGLNFFTPDNESALARVGKSPSGRQGYRTWRGSEEENPFSADKDILDNQVAIIEYANGVRASMHTNANTNLPERRMYLCGSEGTLRADLLKGSIEVRRIGFGEALQNHSTPATGTHGGGDEVLARELVATMLEGAATSTSFEAGLDAAVTCFAIDQAEATGQVVDLQPLWDAVDRDQGS